jgi:hypothetical protein
MKTELIVKVKNVYGNELVYPVCEQSKLFAALANTETLTTQSVAKIKQLGYTFTVESQTL